MFISGKQGVSTTFNFELAAGETMSLLSAVADRVSSLASCWMGGVLAVGWTVGGLGLLSKQTHELKGRGSRRDYGQ